MPAPATFPYRDQPYHGLYLAAFIVKNLLFNAPCWAIKYCIPSLRPNPSWTWSRSMVITLFQSFNSVISKTGKMKSPDHKALNTNVDNIGVWIPAAPHLIQGQIEEWASLSHVSPIDIPGYWYHRPGSIVPINAPASPDEKVVLNFHGGAYILDSAHPSGYNAPFVTDLLQNCSTIRRVFSVEYRLSSSAPYPVGGQFPAALIDGVAGYAHLVNKLGFKPKDIVISGESSGGHLVLSLTRYIVENPDIFPERPGGLILVYPWADMSESHNIPSDTALKNGHTDILGSLYDGTLLYATNSFLGPHSPDLNPYLSPGSINPAMDSIVSFKGFPPSFLCVAGYERFRDQVHVVRDRMVRDMGADSVQYEEPEHAVHGFMTFTWHEPERTEMLKKMAKWISRLP